MARQWCCTPWSASKRICCLAIRTATIVVLARTPPTRLPARTDSSQLTLNGCVLLSVFLGQSRAGGHAMPWWGRTSTRARAPRRHVTVRSTSSFFAFLLCHERGHSHCPHRTVCTCQLAKRCDTGPLPVSCALCAFVGLVCCVLCAFPVLRGVPGAAHRRVAPSPLTVSQMYAHHPVSQKYAHHPDQQLSPLPTPSLTMFPRDCSVQ